jgi:hypothetical protein
MTKEFDVDNGKLQLRLTGTPENGGNRNNYVEIDGDPFKQRVGLGGDGAGGLQYRCLRRPGGAAA